MTSHYTHKCGACHATYKTCTLLTFSFGCFGIDTASTCQHCVCQLHPPLPQQTTILTLSTASTPSTAPTCLPASPVATSSLAATSSNPPFWRCRLPRHWSRVGTKSNITFFPLAIPQLGLVDNLDTNTASTCIYLHLPALVCIYLQNLAIITHLLDFVGCLGTDKGSGQEQHHLSPCARLHHHDVLHLWSMGRCGRVWEV